MAFDFKNLLLQGGAAGLGAMTGLGPFAGIGAGLLQGMGDAFGLSSGGGGTTPINMAKQVQEAASFTSTGAEGAAATRESAEAARRFIGQQTAEGRLAAQRQQALGSQALGGAQQTTDLARSAALMNLGNQNRDLMQQAAAGRATPAALAGIASNTGQSNLEVMKALAQQGAQAQQQAFQTAGQAFGAAEQIRNQDLSQQKANFDPYSLQKFGGTNLGQITGYQQAEQQMRAAEDPLALLKAMGGQGAIQAYNKPYDEETLASAIDIALARQQRQPSKSTMLQEMRRQIGYND
jgi:hypothetical protein